LVEEHQGQSDNVKWTEQGVQSKRLEDKMKLPRLFFLLLFVLLFASPAGAQGSTSQTQWTIVTTSESAPNATPVQYDINGTAINCAGQNPDNQDAWDNGHAGPQGDCYNPLTITFDLNMPSSSNWTATASTLNDNGTNVLSLTNSIDSNNGSVSSITVKLASGTYTVTVTNEDGTAFTFTGRAQTDPMSATFTSASGDKGEAQMYNETVVPTWEYTGAFEHNNSDQVLIDFGPQPAANYSLNTIWAIATSSKNVCFVHLMSSSDSLASSYGPAYVSGDLVVFVLGDGQGNAIELVGTPGINEAGVFDNVDSSTEFFTFYVLASTNSACPAGTSSYDSPFTRKPQRVQRPTILPPHLLKP
jgi:hypothetical protein